MEAFLWGAGISAHQTEGMNRMSDWWEFEHSVLQKRGVEPSASCVDHWHRFREDINLLADNGFNAFRFSVEWAKIEPREGEINEDALLHYDEVIRYAKQRHLTLCLTLWHFTLPLWAKKKGGMLNKDVQERFFHFARICAKRWGNDVQLWITINEPMVYLMEGYRWGHWPPNIHSVFKPITVFFALRRVHRKTYSILKKEQIESIGIAKSVISFVTQSRFPLFQAIQGIRNIIWNIAFFVGEWHSHDFIGINYYITSYLGKAPKTTKDAMGWSASPEGFLFAMKQFKHMSKPLFITENGIATDHDDERITYLQSHLPMISKAKSLGIDIRGYFYWSLLDNYEWDKGFSKRFGLVAVDRATMDRKPKQSLEQFGI